MAELNNPGCALVVGGNTGVPGCVFTPSNIVGAILIDKSRKLLKTEIESGTFLTTLQTKTMAVGKDRIYPIFRFEEVTDNSEEATIATLGYGSKQLVKEGKYDLTFRHVKGGQCLQNKLRNFNHMDMKVLFVDSNNTIIGTLNADGDVVGLSMDFLHAAPVKMADGTNPAIYTIRFALSKPEELNDNVAFIKMDVDVEENVKGIIDLTLSEVSKTSGSVKVAIKTSCDKVNLFDLYSDDLAEGNVWVVKDSSGDDVVVSGVTADTATKSWSVAFTGTGVHTITLVPPANLDAAEIGGYPDNPYEASVLRVTMPGNNA